MGDKAGFAFYGVRELNDAAGRQHAPSEGRESGQPVVFVIDDDPSVRDLLATLLGSVGIVDRGCSASTQEFLGAVPPEAPGCLILDVRMPGRSGLDFQNDLAKAQRSLPIIFITGHGDIAMSVKAMKAGAVEFLTKPFRDQDLLDAIQVGLERDRAQRREAAALAQVRERFQTLTQREQEVLTGVAAGFLNREIAAQLKLSEITVKMHRGHVMQKMKAASLAELVTMANLLRSSGAAGAPQPAGFSPDTSR